MDVIQEARRLRERADALLERSGLIERLERHGEVHPSGAYAYDLMMSPDIDLHLAASDFSRSDAAKLAQEFMHDARWLRATFEDRVQWPYPGLPRGYYLGTRVEFDGETWKVDTWMLDAAMYQGDVWAPVIAGISHEERVAILELKAARTIGVLSAKGVDIYEAVVDRGVRTVEQFLDSGLDECR